MIPKIGRENIRMKALVYDGKLKYSAGEPRPSVSGGEAIVRVLKAGICNTDLEIVKGYKGFSGILGHEFVGIAEEIDGDGRGLLGKRVVGEINCACRREDCEFCRRGLGRHCPSRTALGIFGRDGCFAEYVAVPVENLFEVPDGVPDETAVFVEPLAAAFEILEQIELSPDLEVLIAGDGKLGLLVNHALSTAGAKITHAGKHPEKLKLAGKNGCRTVLLDDMPDRKYDVVVEATGRVGGFKFAVDHVKPRGTVVLKSTLAGSPKIDLNPVVVNEITLVGSRCGRFQPALDYLSKARDLSEMITAAYPIGKGLEAFEAAATPGSLKVLIDCT